MRRVEVNKRAILFGQRAMKARRDAQVQTAWRDGGLFGHQGAGGNDRALADYDVIQEHRRHADEAVVFDAAAVEHRAMPDRDPVADDCGRARHGVQNASVLYVAVRPDADGVNVAAQHGPEPDTRVLADFHAADDDGALGDVSRFGDAGAVPLIGANHDS